MKKYLFFLMFIFFISFVYSRTFVETYNDPLTKSIADLRYCVRFGDCTLDNLIVDNLTVNNIFNVTTTNIFINITNLQGEHWVNESGDVMTGFLNTTDFYAEHYLTQGTGISFNWYDDGSESFLNMTGVTDAFNIETDNSKISLFNEPNFANDYKVFQVFSKQAQFETALTVYKAGNGRGTVFSRSGIFHDTAINCTEITDMVDCISGGSGNDVIIKDELWTNGTAYIGDGAVNVSQTGNITVSDSLRFEENTHIRFNGTCIIMQISSTSGQLEICE